MFQAGFEPTIPASERPQTYALVRAATGIGLVSLYPWETPGTHRTGMRESLGPGQDGTENIASTRIRFIDLPSRIQSLHPLLYPRRLYSDVQCLNSSRYFSNNSVALVRERTIPTEWPPPVGEVSANFCG